MTLTQETIRDDVRTIWKMGFFDDVQVEVSEGKAGSVVTFILREKPAIQKIYVAGNEEVALRRSTRSSTSRRSRSSTSPS